MTTNEGEPVGPPSRPQHLGLIDPGSSRTYLDTERAREQAAEKNEQLGLLVQAKINQVTTTDTPILDKGSNYPYK